MEIYLLVAVIVVYIMTALLMDQYKVRRIWTLAFMAASILTAVAIVFVHIYHQTVLLGANPLNWYYLLYLFAASAVVLGLINAWMYRGAIWRIMRVEPETDENKE